MTYLDHTENILISTDITQIIARIMILNTGAQCSSINPTLPFIYICSILMVNYNTTE